MFKTIENGKIMLMECSNDNLVTYLTGNKFFFSKLFLKSFDKGILINAVVKHQIRDTKSIPDKLDYIIKSVDSRVVLEYFDNLANQFVSPLS